MADSFTDDIIADPPANPGGDVEMGEGAEEGSASASVSAIANANPNGSELLFAEEGPDDTPEVRVSFAQYLTSPVVTLIVGSSDAETILTAHQALLTQSPFFAEACAEFADDGSVSYTRIEDLPTSRVVAFFK